MRTKTQLLCTFTTKDEIDERLDEIQYQYLLLSNKIFILELVDTDDYIITYNIEKSPQFTFIKDTILIHRKKETNTLYTINALNSLIRDLNDGYLDKSYRVDWTDYRNSIILTDSGTYRVISTNLYRIFKVR